ncbi:unnamed protein product, partial [Rotaria sp. Silwood1]
PAPAEQLVSVLAHTVPAAPQLLKSSNEFTQFPNDARTYGETQLAIESSNGKYCLLFY